MGTQQLVILCSYGYDPLDRLISQRQPDASNRQRFYCKSRLATEIQGTIANTIFQKDGLLLAQLQNQNKEVTSTLLSTDQQRSVLYTLKAGNQRQPIAYSSYGHHHAESGLTSLLGFNGERPDPVTGCYLLGNGYRAFNPVLMRFNSPDSWSPFGEGGINSYMYCKGDPVNRSDATGHMPTWVLATALTLLASKKTPTIIKTINAKTFSSATTKTSTYLTTYKHTNSLGHKNILAYAHSAPMNTPHKLPNMTLTDRDFINFPEALKKELPSQLLNKYTGKFDIDIMINENIKKLINSNPQTQIAMKIDTYNMALRGNIPYISVRNATASLNALPRTPQNAPILRAFGYIDPTQTRETIRRGY
jgi:RHS repeat-associated protein